MRNAEIPITVSIIPSTASKKTNTLPSSISDGMLARILREIPPMKESPSEESATIHQYLNIARRSYFKSFFIIF